MRSLVTKVLARFNYKLTRNRAEEFFSKEFLDVYYTIKPYTMVDEPTAYAAWQAIEYVANRGIPGAIVECGVWRGGVSMLMAECVRQLGVSDRKQYLYDTFEGMSAPTDKDKDKHGSSAADQLANSPRADGGNNIWAYASLEDVKQNFRKIGYSPDSICMIKGKVEDTIPASAPEKIAVLRLDTDWYESTKHELEHLYPRLGTGGVLLIDDYGYWSGCREAVDEYFTGDVLRPYFAFQSDGSVIAIKI